MIHKIELFVLHWNRNHLNLRNQMNKKNYSCYIEILETIYFCGTKWFILNRIIRVTLKYLKPFNFQEPNDLY